MLKILIPRPKIVGAAYTRDHLSIVLLNSQLWTSFSQINTVLVSKRSPAIELCRLDFCSNFNFFTSTVGFNNEDNCCQSQEFKKSIKDNNYAFKRYFKH